MPRRGLIARCKRAWAAFWAEPQRTLKLGENTHIGYDGPCFAKEALVFLGTPPKLGQRSDRTDGMVFEWTDHPDGAYWAKVHA